jgi:DNA replication protein DnaC
MRQIKLLAEELGMKSLYQALEEQSTSTIYSDIPFTDRLKMLLEAEVLQRHNKKIERLQKEAKLQEKSARIEDIDFSHSRGLTKGAILELAGGNYITTNKNIILTGPTGTGKSYVAQSLANKAMTQGHSTLYIRVPRLMQHLSASKGDEEYLKLLAKLKKIKLLILDDLGVSPLKASETRDLLEIVEDRTNLSSLIITSQLPIHEWHSYLHNPTIADAILDRVVHNAYTFELKGESQRKLKKTTQQSLLEKE